AAEQGPAAGGGGGTHPTQSRSTHQARRAGCGAARGTGRDATVVPADRAGRRWTAALPDQRPAEPGRVGGQRLRRTEGPAHRVPPRGRGGDRGKVPGPGG